MKLPFSKKTKDEELMETTELSDEELAREGYDVSSTPDAMETKEVGIIETREFSTLPADSAIVPAYHPVTEEDEDDEYEYITPHYGMNAVMITILFMLIGAAVTFFLTKPMLTESIRQGYIDRGYINTRNATASQNDIAFGKRAYTNVGGVDGSFVEIDTSNATATSEDILLGYTAYVNGLKVTGVIPTFNPSLSYSPGNKDIVIPKGIYISGNLYIKGEPNLKPENIRDGVSIFDVKGTYKYEENQ